MIVDPPSLEGTIQSTVAEPSPALAVTFRGTPGTVFGTTYELQEVLAESPTALVALTRNRYSVPLVRPEQVAEVPVIVQDPPAESTST